MSSSAKTGSPKVTPLRPKGDTFKGPSLATITPAQRAAVVIAVLGETAARPIVEKLDDRALAQIAAELENISYLPREDLADIVMDFLSHLRQTSGAFRGGKTRSREIVEKLLDESRLSTVFGGGEDKSDKPVNTSDGVWDRLQQKPPAAIAAYLDRMTPNIVAMILRKLDTGVASEVVGHLDESKLDATMGHLIEADSADPEIDNVMARMIEIEFLNNADVHEEEDTSHLESIGEMLSLIPSDRRERVLSYLKSEHETKLESIEKVLFTIEGLPDMLARSSVPVVFRELGETKMVPLLSTLHGPSSAVSDYLLGNISSRLADQFRDQLNDPNRKPVEDEEATQREFLTSLMALKRRGLIVMEKAPKA
ncbi:FliG C-terminal domain-containing protein [Henriciella litoralis]|uniref:FliG C-terminal domain-containing protein n=1 Tax=Henriciella litoralis TaxID=568102 RepID=UPI000A05558B|nr:FliG C-terminal domain-containing protein [Henriciella litoralis]